MRNQQVASIIILLIINHSNFYSIWSYTELKEYLDSLFLFKMMTEVWSSPNGAVFFLINLKISIFSEYLNVILVIFDSLREITCLCSILQDYSFKKVNLIGIFLINSFEYIIFALAELPYTIIWYTFIDLLNYIGDLL